MLWNILCGIGVLPGRYSEIRGAIVGIAKTNSILEHPLNEVFPTENADQDNNKTDKAREQKLRRQAVVVGELKRKCQSELREHWGGGVFEHHKY